MAGPMPSVRAICRRTEERKLIVEATREIAQHEGTAPRGWLGPWISESDVTPDLLKEAGYDYVLDWCHDDRPVAAEHPRRPAAIGCLIRRKQTTRMRIVVRRMTASDFADVIVDQFDEMLMQAKDTALVCPISLHPHVSGQAHRMKHLRRALTHIAKAREQSDQRARAISDRGDAGVWTDLILRRPRSVRLEGWRQTLRGTTSGRTNSCSE